MAILSKIKMLYRPKEKKGTKSAAVILEALEENFDAIREAMADLNETDLNELKEYFNSVTSEDDLGDVLFNEDNTFEDVQSRINALDDEA